MPNADEWPICDVEEIRRKEALMSKRLTIYVALLNEGTDCWRPVEASVQNDGAYLLSGSVPEFEEWEFAPGSTVLCEQKKFADGEVGLVAVMQVR